ncbi:MAG: hypothetical protein ABH815_05670 [Candidatus Omnitrophota bacterium]
MCIGVVVGRVLYGVIHPYLPILGAYFLSDYFRKFLKAGKLIRDEN